jgi:hypothetical protein
VTVASGFGDTARELLSRGVACSEHPVTFRQPAPAGEGGGRVANQCATSENFLKPLKACSDPEASSHPNHRSQERPNLLLTPDQVMASRCSPQ